jgi:hypothetical protein
MLLRHMRHAPSTQEPIDGLHAAREGLAGITASVANPETFLRFGVDHPAFFHRIRPIG